MATSFQEILRFIANQLKCPICFDLFTEPVTLACGHSYCLLCINNHFDRNVRRDCPQCRAELGTNPKPHKNVTINKILELQQVGGRGVWDRVLTGSDREFAQDDRTHASSSSPSSSSSVETSDSSLELKGGCESVENVSRPAADTQTDEPVGNSAWDSGENRVKVTEDPDAPGRFSVAGTSAAPGADFVSLSFSPRDGHRRLVFHPQSRKLEVQSFLSSRTHCSHFEACQWMAEQEFTAGRHFWDVETSASGGWAAGVAYAHLGKAERLGRSKSSWCIEWSNNRFSAWHDGAETPLKHRPPDTLRVLLDMDKGRLSFCSKEDGEAALYRVQVEFRAQIRPVFWLFGTKPGNALSFPGP